MVTLNISDSSDLTIYETRASASHYMQRNTKNITAHYTHNEAGLTHFPPSRDDPTIAQRWDLSTPDPLYNNAIETKYEPATEVGPLIPGI
ncbi:predicted protein [Botrytis cinerea T4]|uniref:Uncharacterized protein n=1 Tax=Botryotinia fuckeliana (strain T4) TaxID=999810 RepID=G2Y801_BOTF4|nr:predicted protein [Botrytis cinerea T4]